MNILCVKQFNVALLGKTTLVLVWNFDSNTQLTILCADRYQVKVKQNLR